MVDPSPFSSERLADERSRFRRGDPRWLLSNRRLSGVFVLLLVVATALLSR